MRQMLLLLNWYGIMKQLLAKIQRIKKRLYWKWHLDRHEKYGNRKERKTYKYTVTVVGAAEASNRTGWIYYSCKDSALWLVGNGIYDFRLVERFISSKDYKLHFVIGFKDAEDAMAFRLGYIG